MACNVALLQNTKSARITRVQFGLMNPESVRKGSAVDVVKPSLYVRHVPATGSMNDLKMGTCDRRFRCSTCRHDVIKCPGHYGHMNLAWPMYHPGMIGTVLKTLRCVCFFCSKLLVRQSSVVGVGVGSGGGGTGSSRDRLATMVGLCRTRRVCEACGGSQPKYSHVRGSAQMIVTSTATMQFESDEERAFANAPFTAARARSILSGITDEAISLLGGCPTYARPEWMILTVLVVPPPIARPCITASDGSRMRGQDDVTLKLVEILKANRAADAALRSAGLRSGSSGLDTKERTTFHPGPSWRIETTSHASGRGNVAPVYVALDTLQHHIVQYLQYGVSTSATGSIVPSPAVSPPVPTTPTTTAPAPSSTDIHPPPPTHSATVRLHTHGRALRLIPERWRGKKGRFRGNLAGKRVNFSSRTVASPAPDYDVDEVGIPIIVATNLTFPERVTRFNRQTLHDAVVKGPGKLKGATTITVPGCDPLDLHLCDDDTRLRLAHELTPGWVVERHLVDGDWVLLNRQPSLHRMSIMAHKVRVIQDKTFRLPVCDTTPYNADFDGDELNVHAIQTHNARAEAATLMSASTQIINPENNKPIIALVQDSLVAAFLLTQPGTFLRRHTVMQLCMGLRHFVPHNYQLPVPAILKPTPLWTGKQVFSLLFHPTFSYTRAAAVKGDPPVTIVHGQLLSGVLCKRTLGTVAGGLVHVFAQDWGLEHAAKFIGDAQRLLRDFMMVWGFSAGVGDCIMSQDGHRKVDAFLNAAFVTTDGARHDAAGTPAHSHVDAKLTTFLGSMLAQGSAIALDDAHVKAGNNICTMIECGAKGSAINVAQILAYVGQQSVEGGRIQLGMDNRTLPCFRAGDTSNHARGFVCNSYATGLTAQEYFFHAMGGREGLVDTAVKTASTGYIQRRLAKAQEGLQVAHDGTVRNANGDVIQFYYGGDSFYPTRLERTSLWSFTCSNQEVHERVVGSWDAWKGAVGAASADTWIHEATLEADRVCELRDGVRKSHLALQTHHNSGTLVMPFDVPRILSRAHATFNVTSNGGGGGWSAASPHQFRHMLNTALYHRISNARRTYASSFTLTYLKSHLTMYACVVQHRLSPPAVQWVCDRAWKTYSAALADAGEMVGTVGASSIGGPCTQMTLNTFHTAGVLAHTVTQGVPRLKELIDMSARIRTPSIRVAFQPDIHACETRARQLACQLQSTVLHQVVHTSSVEWNPAKDNVVPPDDAPIVQLWCATSARRDYHDDTTTARCVLRFGLCRRTMMSRQLTVHHVGCAVQRLFGSRADVWWSEVNMVQWVVRVRARYVEPEEVALLSAPPAVELQAGRALHDHLLDTLVISGVVGISKVMVQPVHSLAVVGCGKDDDADDDNKEGALRTHKGWEAHTEGTNLATVMATPGVDACHTWSNDIYEMLGVLGIEAAAHQLLTEIRAVLSHDGAYVNDRHLQVLVDVMTQGGSLAPVTRHSMLKLGASVYTRASFEQSQEVLTWAAVSAVNSPTFGVTENIMLGLPINGGTGACDVITNAEGLPAEPRPYSPSSACIGRPPLLQSTTDTRTTTQRNPIVAPLVKERGVNTTTAANSGGVTPLKPSKTHDYPVEVSNYVGKDRRGGAKRKYGSVVHVQEQTTRRHRPPAATVTPGRQLHLHSPQFQVQPRKLILSSPVIRSSVNDTTALENINTNESNYC